MGESDVKLHRLASRRAALLCAGALAGALVIAALAPLPARADGGAGGADSNTIPPVLAVPGERVSTAWPGVPDQVLTAAAVAAVRAAVRVAAAPAAATAVRAVWAA